jgi:hypothetical protein
MVSKQYYNCGSNHQILGCYPRRQLYCCYKTNISVSQKTPFEIKFPFVDPNVVLIPNYISPNNDGVNDTWILPQEYGSNTEIVLLNSRGEVVYKQIIIRIIGRRTNLILSL